MRKFYVPVVILAIALAGCSCSKKDNTAIKLRGHISPVTGRVILRGHASLPSGKDTPKVVGQGAPATTTIAPPNFTDPAHPVPIKVTVPGPDEVIVTYFYNGNPPLINVTNTDDGTGTQTPIPAGTKAPVWNSLNPFNSNFSIFVGAPYNNKVVSSTTGPNGIIISIYSDSVGHTLVIVAQDEVVSDEG